MRRGIAVVLLALAAARGGFAQRPADSVRADGWRGDVDAWMRQAAAQLYVLRQGPMPQPIRDAAARFKRLVPSWSDERALAELMRLAALAGDGHTYISPFGAARVQSRWLPLRFYQFTDGMFVIDADSGLERWIGARVDAIAGVPIADLAVRVRPYMARDNDAGAFAWKTPLLLRFAGYLEAITERRVGATMPVRLRSRAGRDTTVEIPFVPAPEQPRSWPKLVASRLPGAPPAPRYLRNVPNAHWLEPIGDTVVYAQFNQVTNTPDESLADFARKLDAALSSPRVRVAIIDARHNNGGNLRLLDPLIAAMMKFSGAPRRGRLIVISGRNTFSAAQNFLGRAEYEARAEIAGEPSSSRPNFVGEENRVILPFSGAAGSISNFYWESIPGDKRSWIEPTIRVDLSSADYFSNRDPVLERLLGRPIVP
jgi:hypothetical protein